jgi:hypothetical protein
MPVTTCTALKASTTCPLGGFYSCDGGLIVTQSDSINFSLSVELGRWITSALRVDRHSKSVPKQVEGIFHACTKDSKCTLRNTAVSKVGSCCSRNHITGTKKQVVDREVNRHWQTARMGAITPQSTELVINRTSFVGRPASMGLATSISSSINNPPHGTVPVRSWKV